MRLCAATLLVGFGGAAVAFVADSEPVSAGDGVEATERCEITAEQPTVNVVMLLDASASLRATDPGNARRDGLEAAVNNLAALTLANPAVKVSVAVDVFASGYQREHGWSGAGVAQQELVGRFGEITRVGRVSAGNATDYGRAMSGVAERLRSAAAPASDCNLLLWFTDGVHDPRPPFGVVSEDEWDQLRAACRSEDMRYLSARGLYTVGVLLSAGEPADSAPLRHLFDETAEGCEHELDGEIRADVDVDVLRNELDELINEVVYEVSAEAETDDDLPNEQDGVPDEGEYSECAAGDGTEGSPCEIPFSLDEGHESFRVFVDMTFLGRELSNPEAVNFNLAAPSGERSAAVVAPVAADAAETGHYQPVLPFWFLSRRPYDSRWEVIGHQAAEQLARPGHWEWAGEWKLLFWGDDDVAAADARKVAAAVRTVAVESASAEAMSLTDRQTLIGFVENYPSADYSAVVLNLEPRDSTGEPLYATRRYLACEPPAACSPAPVSGAERRFEVPRLFDELVWWDSEQAGGNGLELRNVIAERGPVSLAAVLTRQFRYGGSNGYGSGDARGEPLRWTNDVGSIALDGLADYLGGERQWQELVDWVESGEPPALPFGVDLASPPLEVAGDAVTFAVTVQPGYLPGVITIDGVSARSGAETVPVEGYDREWSCQVAGTRGRAGAGAADCAAIGIDLGVSKDSDVVVELDYSTGPDSGLEDFVFSDAMTVPSPQERAALWEEIQRATQPRSESVDSEPFRVDIATPGDKFGKFWPILVALVALAALMRLLVARGLRRWHELTNADFVTKRLDLGQTGGQPRGDDAVEVDSCMALTGRAVEGTLGCVTVKSAWLPLLTGRGPSLQATSTRGGCIGPEGYRDGRGGRIGLIGRHLHGGWVVEVVGDQHYLVVWDLGDEPERSTRIAEVEDAAREKVLEMRTTAQAHGRGATSAADDSVGSDGDRGPTPERGTTSRSSGPFEDSSAPFDDTQPPSDPFDGPDDPFGEPRDPFG